MFWYFLLAHFIADYPLQPNWLVTAKKTPLGLLRHVAVHTTIMLLIVGSGWVTTWPIILLITAIHWLVDYAKSWLGQLKPDWVISTYIADQFFHITALWVIDFLFSQPILSPISEQTAIYLSGILLVSHVCFITERVLNYKDKGRVQQINQQMWSRMLTRSASLSALIIAPLGWFFPAALGLMLALQWPYPATANGRRDLLIDIAVVLTTFTLLQLLGVSDM